MTEKAYQFTEVEFRDILHAVVSEYRYQLKSNSPEDAQDKAVELAISREQASNKARIGEVSTLAIKFLERQIKAGHQIEIPSLGITIGPDGKEQKDELE